ncbi:hypothetical protein THIOM_000974 [Candidatus Thiomargarita nelsonii]|uniref:Uncharacterized protein n=1 Tax=Candidatus Thiomargarita nelsonii TaxID=1003181 RepID=A0A176S5L3_9GAMM|nr:hypothetical protein THIOM_000974 [Candidatus Thiomargarita nelsonii]
MSTVTLVPMASRLEPVSGLPIKRSPTQFLLPPMSLRNKTGAIPWLARYMSRSPSLS